MNFVIFRGDEWDGPPDWINHLKKVKGTVQEVEIISENRAVCTVEVKSTNFRITFNKWPKDYWGKVRGVFESKNKALEALATPTPIFDHDGHLINKISKSG